MIDRQPALPLPDDFPWDHTIGLLLDAAQVKNLLPRLYQWDPQVTVEVLYLRTRLAKFRELSPCLVRLKGADDPILKQFLLHIQERWGYLLISDAPWEQVTAHWRWLVSVEHPSGEPMLLRIAAPAFAYALLYEADNATVRLFGPCQRVMIPSQLLDSWDDYARPGAALASNHAVLYRLDEGQVDLLDMASRNQRLTDLHWHMAEFFPDYRTELSPRERWQHLRHLADVAGDLGFEGEASLWRYANAHGFLGEQLYNEPEIAGLLKWDSPIPGATRLAMLTQWIERRSHS
jgi:hypothetical protein